MENTQNIDNLFRFFLKKYSIILFLLITGSSGQVWGINPPKVKNDSLTIDVKEVSIKEVLSHIKKQSGYVFLYHGTAIDLNKKVTVKAYNQSIQYILGKLFEGLNLEYIITGRQIIIRHKSKEENSVPEEKKMTTSGTVKGTDGIPLAGVHILLSKEQLSTITDQNGSFTLKNIPENSRLLFSYIGYKPQELSARPYLEIVLQEDTEMLDEIVVLGYGIQKKVNLSGSIATVETEMIRNRPVSSVGHAIQGLIPNMNVTINSGQVTESPYLNIRGVTSINGGEPLVVIDGVASTKEQLNWMNPVDIVSISILKDAAASAIYGSRAAYGVILVTTRNGSSEKLSVNYSNNFALHTVTQKPQIVSDPYLVATTVNTMSAPWSKVYTEEQLALAKKRSEDPSISPYFINHDGSFSVFANTDWVGDAYKKSSFSHTHNIDFSGKGQHASYFLSAGYNYQDGIIRYGTDKYHRYNLRSKIDLTISDRWSIRNNISVQDINYDAPTYLGGGYYWEVNRISPLAVAKTPDGNDWTSEGASVFGRLQEGGRKTNKKQLFVTQFSTKVDIIPNMFRIEGTFSYSVNKFNEKGHTLPVAYYAGVDKPKRYYNETSSAYSSESTTKHILYDIYGTFRHTINDNHFVSVLLGFNQEEYKTESTSVGRKDLLSNLYPSFGLATGDISLSETISSWALRGAFMRLNYIVDNTYIFEFNGRYDGTSRFPKKSRFTFNPSGSVAWIVSNEDFFLPLANLANLLKIRFSYGVLGNQDVNPYAYIPTMRTNKMAYILDDIQPVYISASQLVSDKFTWEKVITTNAGLDINLFNDRLTLSADAYIRKTKDMLAAGARLPGVLGTSAPLKNVADLETKGWELALGWKDSFKLAGKRFGYQLHFNLADSRSYITKYHNPTGTLYDYYKGQRIGEIWGLTTEGFFVSQEDINTHANQTTVTSYPTVRPLAPGDLKFRDVNKDGRIDWGNWTVSDPGDYRIIGNSEPRYTFGFMAGFEWNNFDFSIFFQGVGKRDYYPQNGDLFFWGIYSQPWTNITYGNYYDRWTEETPNGYFPRFKSYVADGTEAALVQTRYLQNAAYVRLKNMTIGYNLPQTLTRKAGISNVRFFFSGDNLAELTGLYKHYKVDPEGLNGQMYPFQRSYSIGLNVSF